MYTRFSNIRPPFLKVGFVFNNSHIGCFRMARLLKKLKAQIDSANIYLTSKDIINWINIFIDCPNKDDIKNMTNIHVGTDSAHRIYEPLFIAQYSWKDMIKNFSQVKTKITKNLWLTTGQKIFLCCFYPLSIHTKGFRMIDIKIFPYLQRQYGNFKLQFLKKYYYSITIGNQND